jgi:RluA family pseudouridine synthase
MADVAPILFEDESLLVVDKPAGIAVIPGRGEEPGDALRGRLEAARGAGLFVVHRLDRDTSGVLLFAKTAAAHRAYSMAFEARRMEKAYEALVAGAPPAAAGVCEIPLVPGRKGRVNPAPPGRADAWPCRTAYEVLRRPSPRLTVVRFRPATGRQHQLRVHAAALGAPILGDPLYAFGDARSAAPRLMLHASELAAPAIEGRPARLFRSSPPALFAEIEASLSS